MEPIGPHNSHPPTLLTVKQVAEILQWNPMVQIVEWVRLAYDPNFGAEVDYLYVLMISMSALAIGLIMERTLVRQLT